MKSQGVEPVVPEKKSEYGDSAPGTHKVLEQAVDTFMGTFSADRCSIFLYDEASHSIKLRATRGFPMFGKATIVLKLGEGLVGRALMERRTIYTDMASSMHGYVKHPNFPDDDVQTVLIIPLLRAKERIGVISMNRRTGTPFLDNEISAARVKAEELAVSIQSASALLFAEDTIRSGMSVRRLHLTDQTIFKGTSVSDGIAIGEARVLISSGLSKVFARKDVEIPSAVRSLDEAVKMVERRFAEITKILDERMPEAASMIFEASQMMLQDDSYIGKIKSLVSSGVSVTKAVIDVSYEFIQIFESSSNEYMQEKAADVEDLALRLLECLTQNSFSENLDDYPHIIISEKLLPSDILRIARNNIQGIVLKAGGNTAHVTFLVRSMKIPMIIVHSKDLLNVCDGETIIIDCFDNKVFVRPDKDTVTTYKKRLSEMIEAGKMQERAEDETYTVDGMRVVLSANVNIIADVNFASNVNAEGIGLCRTEFSYLMRQTKPTEIEQVNVYSRILATMGNKPVTFRTLDAGGDKIIPYLFKTKEENPALGLRSIRLSLRYPHIFDQQLRAIIRAIQVQQRDNVSVMFPMISSVEEFIQAREHVETAISDVCEELGGKEILRPKIGAMIELPATIAVIEDLAKEAEFFSIGTNDFIQYILAVDRTNDNVASQYIAAHPAVLRSLRIIARAAIRNNIPVSICGEMGRDIRYIPFLIGIGVRSLSIEPAAIPQTQKFIQRLSAEQCRRFANELTSLRLIKEIEKRIDEFMAGCAD